MRSSIVLGLLAAQISPLAAFPHIPVSPDSLRELSQRFPDTVHEERASVPFDPAVQHVSVTGKHAWKAPNFAAGDQRGPCPGLNSLANHGYLPRNGISPWTDIATATTSVFGLGEDIASFLAFYGVLMDGNLFSLSPGYSIGGPSTLAQNILGGGGIIGRPEGLSRSHNKYEGDSSSGRYDLFNGVDYKIDLTRFQKLYELSEAPGDYNLDVWKVHRKNMFEKSKHENPEFFYAFLVPITVQGGFTFPPRMMANKSAAYPDNGLLDRNTLKSFFSVSEQPSGELKYKYGHERIPANFYKRHPSNPYDAALFFEDFMKYSSYFPELLSMGGNTGKVDSYAAIDIGNLTGGIYNGKDLLDPATARCFIFQSMLAITPDVLKGRYLTGSGRAFQLLENSVSKLLGGQSCPEISKIFDSQLKQYPGYKG